MDKLCIPYGVQARACSEYRYCGDAPTGVTSALQPTITQIEGIAGVEAPHYETTIQSHTWSLGQ